MGKISKKTRQITAAVSLTAAPVLSVGLFILWPGVAASFFNEIFFAAILIVLTPSAILDYLNQKWINGIEDQMPVLVRGISECQETGVTFVKAIDKVVEDKMIRPPLSDEVKKLTVQMSWGLSFEDALRNFKNRISSSVVNRFCTLVLEASRSGGQIRKVFTATSGFMEEMRETDKETSSQMRPYLVIIYAAFFVFAFTSVVLLRSFFAPLEAYPQMLSPMSAVSVGAFKDFFYRTMLISALVGGLMAGKIGERRVAGGLKHSIILMVTGYVIFYVLIPPNWMVK
jgi:pilus assembly protein TadC